MIILELPGHGQAPAQADSGTFEGLARSLDDWLIKENLTGIDMVGISLGAGLVLEMARRGRAGSVVALDPGGFWQGWEQTFFRTTITASIALVRVLRPALPALTRNVNGRTGSMPQLSARPWALDPGFVLNELQSFVDTPTFDSLVKDLASGQMQEGPATRSTRVVVGRGRKDRLCLPQQASRAKAAYPEATMHWFEGSGHFPMWDRPENAIRVGHHFRCHEV
ncbi:MAG: alpha/beta hydrolase [Erythrobacter sp.]|nr:alpha/beta hydrolase [Erythrobacter sp.]